MKSTIILIIQCLFLVQISVEQEIEKADIIKFKIKSISTVDSDGKQKFTEFYNDNGNIIKKASPNSAQGLQIDREYFYNDSSQLIEERAYTSSGDVNSKWKYYYNDKSQLRKKEFISDGRVDGTWIYEYDSNGDRISETQSSSTMGNSVTKYSYDLKRLLIQEDKIDGTIGKEEKINYKYSDKNQIVEKKTKSYYFNTTITQTYLYDDKDKLAKIVEKSSNGVSSTIIYEYSNEGLLVSDTWKSSLSKTSHKTTYILSFE